jgi:hypothetical protein
MSKQSQKTDTAQAGQLSLFEVVMRQEIAAAKAAPIPGSLNIRQQIIATLSNGLRHAGNPIEKGQGLATPDLLKRP